MSDSWTPPRVWQWQPKEDNRFSGINRPTAGARFERELPVGRHPLQLYSLATPNGQKVTIMLEELLARGITGAEYDAWYIDIGAGDQFGSGFVAVNPNSKIPALVDRSTEPVTPVFESGAILWYLAEKFDAFLPRTPRERTACLSWLFWQVGAAAFVGGGFGHFYVYADERQEYPINRFTLETKRQLDLLDRRLGESEYVAGDAYTVADMAIWPWYGGIAAGRVYHAAEFLDAGRYTNLLRWERQVGARSAVQRGCLVNNTDGGLRERHDAGDFAGVMTADGN